MFCYCNLTKLCYALQKSCQCFLFTNKNVVSYRKNPRCAKQVKLQTSSKDIESHHLFPLIWGTQSQQTQVKNEILFAKVFREKNFLLINEKSSQKLH